MKFCPKCEVRLKKTDQSTSLSCPKCGHSEIQNKKIKKTQEENTKPDLNVLAENEGKETVSTIKIDCEKCGNDEAVWWMLQTRSADEPTTQFYRCIKCNHTWRNYA